MAYIEPLVPVTTLRRENGSVDAVADENSGLIEIKRLFRPDLSRFGMVIRLTDIWRQVNIVPMFGEKCEETWTCDTAVEEAQTFVANVFQSKEAYQCLSYR